MRFRDKVAVVAGGGRDIGRACVLRLARDGAAVALNYHKSEESAKRAVADVEAAGGCAFAMQGDLTDDAEVKALIDKTVATYGALDVVVANTGGLVGRKTLAEMTVEHWNAVFAVNVTSAMRLAHHAVPHLREGGAIVFIASTAARDGGGRGAVAYAASKGAVMTMTRGIAKELAPKVRVNCVCPGMIDTDFHNIFTTSEARAVHAANTPLQREGLPEDVANLVVYLASHEAAFITGANVDINGGVIFS